MRVVCVCTLVAAALAMQTAEGFVAIFFTLLITSVVTYLNKVKKVDPPILTIAQKVRKKNRTLQTPQ